MTNTTKKIRTVSRCACGARKSKYANRCRKCADSVIAKAHAEAQHAMSKGCPQCGRQVKRNLALTGWVQCIQFGSEGFRADSSKPSCSWQGFTR